MNTKSPHRGHPQRMTLLDRAGTGPGRHYARLDCELCGKFIKWISKRELADGVGYYNKG